VLALRRAYQRRRCVSVLLHVDVDGPMHLHLGADPASCDACPAKAWVEPLELKFYIFAATICSSTALASINRKYRKRTLREEMSRYCATSHAGRCFE